MKKPEVENRYLSARREWNDLRGDDIKALRQWKIVGVAGLAIGLICSGGMVAMSVLHADHLVRSMGISGRSK